MIDYRVLVSGTSVALGGITVATLTISAIPIGFLIAYITVLSSYPLAPSKPLPNFVFTITSNEKMPEMISQPVKGWTTKLVIINKNAKKNSTHLH